MEPELIERRPPVDGRLVNEAAVSDVRRVLNERFAPYSGDGVRLVSPGDRCNEVNVISWASSFG